jgi:hypothetical protein
MGASVSRQTPQRSKGKRVRERRRRRRRRYMHTYVYIGGNVKMMKNSKRCWHTQIKS